MKHTPTQINFEYEGQKFCLEFTADSLKEAEKKYGLKLGNLGENLTTANEDLFCAAFTAHHKFTPKATRLKIYKEFCEETADGEKVMDVIQSMVAEAFEEINSHSGKITWTVQRS